MNKIKWDPVDQISYLNEFLELYNSRPIKDNTGGMKSPHMFNAWYIIKILKPKYIIESGVWKGQGTWFFENASPNSSIISIDPHPEIREYTSSKAQYITDDFTGIDWNKLIDTKDAIIFFDDHQSCIPRIRHASENKFQYIIFEDNYPYNCGDCYSVKKILSKKSYVIDKNNNRTWHSFNNNDYKFIIDLFDIYQEMPPIFKDAFTRWGDKWDNKYETPSPLLDLDKSDQYKIFYDERLDYTWICYIELKNVHQ